ncbi:MAG TPA: UvrD-helicase domain-containing protein, partial [Thermoanaerobaculia bacterium]|nr:UvrD-helicase domain-containing protein [Thermoanaerobaculia bacterium]
FTHAGVAPPARRNIVIDAGAGTGKTTAIVSEVLKLLLSNEDLAPERIVMMTFTEKAAGEIADRVHGALELIERGECPPQYQDAVSGIEDVERVCRKQLERVDGLRSQTIHSFCQSILRMFPIEAGLDPQFRIIEGFERSLLYGQLYDRWADRETRVANDPLLLRDWEHLLAHLDYLVRIRELVFGLVSRRDLLDDPSFDLGSIDDIAGEIAHAVETLRSAAGGVGATLNIVDPLPPPSLDAWIDYFAPIARDIRETNLPAGKTNVDVKNALQVLRGGEKKGDSIYDALVSHRAAEALVAITRRFLSFLDAEKRLLGVADFDDLLLRTAALLENPQIAERVRRQFDYVFVDEFQDTDRVQARIIERLATDRFGAWTDGRMLIVGDPKQSIYAFRRADPETYQRFSDELTKAGAEVRRLTKQWRSHPDLLHAFNRMFARVFANTGADPNVFRPAYHPLESGGQAPAPVPSERITFLYAANGQDSEAEAIAEWIRSRGGELRTYAVLLRRLTKLDHYLDTFDRYGIDYVLPPTRAFLERRAPVELVAVLRAIAHSFDRGAQISAARTPYFALTDEEIAEGLLSGAPPPSAAWQTFTSRIDEYRSAAKQLTVSGVIDLLVESSGIESVYAASVEGRRSLRHLEHLRAIAFTFDEKSGGSIRQFVAEVDRRRSEPDEMEPSLADDDSNAVRILSIHAAKGLEFDTVSLPDLSFPRGVNEGVQVFSIDEPRSLVLTGAVESLS